MVHSLAEWRADGSPWHPATPIKDLAHQLSEHGYTVWCLGDERHLKARPPEDHVPFGQTGWPGTQHYPVVMAMDVKAPGPGSGLPSLQELGRQLRADKMAGHPGLAWLKYMNWEPERDNGGPCWHETWMPEHHRRPSGDRGHLHLSCRTDYTTSTTAAGYDPVARLGNPNRKEDDVSWTDDVIPVKYPAEDPKNKTWAAGNALGHARDLAAETRDRVKDLQAAEAKAKVERAAILKAVTGSAVTASTIKAEVAALRAEIAAAVIGQAVPAILAELRPKLAGLSEQDVQAAADAVERQVAAGLATV